MLSAVLIKGYFHNALLFLQATFNSLGCQMTREKLKQDTFRAEGNNSRTVGGRRKGNREKKSSLKFAGPLLVLFNFEMGGK